MCESKSDLDTYEYILSKFKVSRKDLRGRGEIIKIRYTVFAYKLKDYNIAYTLQLKFSCVRGYYINSVCTCNNDYIII